MTKTGKHILRMVIIDVVVFAIALNAFAFFHHVYDAKFKTVEAVALPVTEATPAPTQAPTPTPDTVPVEATTAEPAVTDQPIEPTQAAEPTPEPTPEPTGLLGAKYADKFSATGVVQDATSYRSQNVAVELTEVNAYDSVIHVLDIYIQDVNSFRTYVPRNEGSKQKELMPIEANDALGGVIAITSGDQFYGHAVKGYIVRNGMLYFTQKDKTADVCVFYNDGTVATFHPKDFDPDKEVAKGVRHIWSFGPALMENGNAISGVKSSISGENPRMALGYYEPGHYCIVEVDAARNSDNAKSKGMTLDDLSSYMASLGCTVAYNLDGGATAGMVFNGTKINKPGRRADDLVYICEPTK